MSKPAPGLQCPSCGATTRLDVKDSRPRENAIHRRRHCRKCGERFSTYEFSEAEIPSMSRSPRDALKSLRAMAQSIIQRANTALRDE